MIRTPRWRREEPLDHAELARLLPAPGDPELSSDRLNGLEEHLMTEIRNLTSDTASDTSPGASTGAPPIGAHAGDRAPGRPIASAVVRSWSALPPPWSWPPPGSPESR